MTHLTIALLAFLGTHLVPSLPGVRATLISHFGRRNYMVIYGTVSLAMLVWLVWAATRAPVWLIWMPAGWQATLTLTLSPLALFLIVAGVISNNPLSLSARANASSRMGGITAITRHPIFWGATLWGASHIAPNGDTRSLLLFGTLTLLAISGFWLGDKRAKRHLGPRWSTLAASTSIIPFGAIIAGRASFRIDREMVVSMMIAGTITAWLLAGGHAQLFGADPIAALSY